MIWLGHIGSNPGSAEGEDPTDGFALRPAAEREAATQRTFAIFAARLEAAPDADPPNWPVHLDGKRLAHGVAIEAWDLVRRGSGPVLERFTRGVVAALAAREDHHRQFLRAAPAWQPWTPHRPAPWDAEMRRAGLVAPLFLTSPHAMVAVPVEGAA